MSEPPAADLGARPTWIALATDGPGPVAAGRRPGGRRSGDVRRPARTRPPAHRGRQRAAGQLRHCSTTWRSSVAADRVSGSSTSRRSMRYEARLHALRLGFDESLPGSIDPDELRGRLALLDQRARPRATDPIPVGRRPRAGPGRPRAAPRRAHRPPATQGVRPARDAGGPSGPGLHPPAAAGPGLGLGARRRSADGRRPRPLAAREDRARAGATRSTSSLCAGSATGWIRPIAWTSRTAERRAQPPEPATAVNRTLTNQQTRVDGADSTVRAVRQGVDRLPREPTRTARRRRAA